MSSVFHKAKAILTNDGVVSLFWRLLDKLNKVLSFAYQRWFLMQSPSDEQLSTQRTTVFENPLLISVITAVYNTDPHFLKELADSLLAQTYPHWEACFYNGGSTRTETLEELKRIAALDERFHIQNGVENEGISVNSNHALREAHGEYVAFCDHDDWLTPNALYEVRKAIEQSGAELLYSDEDKVRGRHFYDGHLKPDFSLDTLRSGNYICHLVVVKRTLALELGGFRSAYDGSQDYDFVLRTVEKTQKIYHIPKVLYHWRMHHSSASHLWNDKCVLRAGAALSEHLQRTGEEGKVFQTSDRQNIIYALHEKPKLSIVFWNENVSAITERRIHELIMQTAYRPLEVIAPGVEDIRFDHEDVTVRRCGLQGRQTIVQWLNEAAAVSSGDVICFIHTSLQPEDREWAAAMLSQVQRQQIGMVTSLICAANGRICYAGYAIGRDHVVSNRAKGFHRESLGYFHSHRIIHNVAAVSWALMMVRKDILRENGYFNAAYHSGLADVDFCQQLLKKGMRNLFTPYGVMLQHGKDMLWDADPIDEALYHRIWKDLTHDPCYSVQFSRKNGSYSLPKAREVC